MLFFYLIFRHKKYIKNTSYISFMF